jgi:alkylation response protein AidB-like acyl-CoA dehydrogenase
MDPTLAKAIEYLKSEVAPKAQQVDGDPELLKVVLDGLCSRDLMALKRPAEFGGPAVSESTFRTFQEEVARVSGSLAFLQTQHQSAVSMISKSDNAELKSAYLPQMGNGGKLVGIGFSQLRRSGPPAITATESPEGYLLTGNVPWITGWSFYPEFLVGATLPDGRALFSIVPFTNQQMDSTSIEFSPPMKLAAMESAMTVSGKFENWPVPQSSVVFIKPTDWIKNNDMINIALQGHFAIGCALAGLDILRSAAEKKDLPFLHESFAKLDRELSNCREATTTAQNEFLNSEDGAESTTKTRLEVRAWAIDLAVRCAHAAITASSGAANSTSHPAQRVYREALVYTVSAQTPAIMEATLDRLTRNSA